MSIQFGNAFIISSMTWQEVKATVATKFLSMQFDEDVSQYTIFAIDNPIVYVTYIRRGDVPDSPGFDQTQNDSDKVDFETNFKASCNKSLENKAADGIKKFSIDGPFERDKKPIFTMSPSTQGFVTWICGSGDDPAPAPGQSGRGTGQPFFIKFEPDEVPSTKVIEFDFIEPIEVHDGQVAWRDVANWGVDDTFSLGLRIPSSSVAANTSSLGNCNKVPVGPGMHIIVPAAGDGAYDLLEGCPVEDKEGQGAYWFNDYDTGAVTASPVPGAGTHNIFDFDITGWLIRNIRMTHPMGVFDIDVYKTEYFHPTWRLRWEVTKNTPGSGSVSGWIFCFRRNVT